MSSHHISEESQHTLVQENSLIAPPVISPKSQAKEKAKKPKRNKSAFIIFSSETRARNKKAYKDLNSNEIMSQLATSWNNLSESERKKYEKRAEQDKERYLAEKKAFNDMFPDKIITNKTEKNHVKKPCSAYALFVQEMKKQIKEKSPEKKMAEILRIIADKWKKLTEEDKKPYQKRSLKEKELAKLKKEKKLGYSKNTKETNDFDKLIVNPKKPFKIIKPDTIKQLESPSEESPMSTSERTAETYFEEVFYSPVISPLDDEVLQAMDEMLTQKENTDSLIPSSPSDFNFDLHCLGNLSDDYTKGSEQGGILNLLNFDYEPKSCLSLNLDGERSGEIITIKPWDLFQSSQKSSTTCILNDFLLKALNK